MAGYGQEGTLQLQFQNSFGTQLTNSLEPIQIISESIVVEKPPLISQEMKGIFDEGPSYEGLNSIAGDLQIEINNTTLGFLCRAVLGEATVVSSDGLRTHTFKPATTDFDEFSARTPFTVVKDLSDAGSAQVLYDLVGSTLELSVANGELVKATMGVVGGKYLQEAATTPTFTVDSGWTWDVGSFSLGGAAISDLADLTVSVDNALANRHTINGNKTPSHTKRDGFRTVAINGTMIFTNQTEYQKFIAQSEERLSLFLATGTEAQSGYNESLEIIAPAFRYTAFAPTLGGPNLIEVGFEGMAKYHTGSGTALQITLVNTHLAY